MKKVFLFLAGIICVAVLNAQSVDEIVKKFAAANKYEKAATLKTIRISAKMSMMGMDIPIEMWMKNPNKIKVVQNLMGQEIIQVFDGTNGYLVNPASGGTTPVPLTKEQIVEVQRNNLFTNPLDAYLKEGKLTLEGEESVKGKPAYKLKVTIDPANPMTVFIDKASYLLVKSAMTVNQGGASMAVESYPSDYQEIGGILVPMKTTLSATGIEMVTTFTKVEVDTPIDDSVFKLK